MLLRKGEFRLFPVIYLDNFRYGVAPCIWWLGLELYWGEHARDWKQRMGDIEQRKRKLKNYEF